MQKLLLVIVMLAAAILLFFASSAAPVQAEEETELWGGLSISLDGAYGSAWNYSDDFDAYLAAQEGCKKVSRWPARCETQTVAATSDTPGWLVAIHCRDSHQLGAYVAYGEDPSETLDYLLEYAYRVGDFFSDECRHVVSIAADGSHKQ